MVKLIAVFAMIGIGWAAGRTRLLGPEAAGVLGTAVLTVFAPALLFRATAAIAVRDLPWTTLAAYYLPTVGLFLLGYGWQRLRRAPAPAAPVRGLMITFGNTVQLGLPIVTALYGADGIAVLVGIITLQAAILLTLATVLSESSLASSFRAPAAAGSPAWSEVGSDGDAVAQWWGRLALAARTARRSMVHPVVLPILLGLAFHATGATLPAPVDDVLGTLGLAVVPVSLVTIGLSLHLHGIAGSVRPAVAFGAGKLLLQPALVLAVSYLWFGLRGLPLAVAVLCAALPIGANVLLFAERYQVLQAEVTAATVVSTTAFLVTSAGWLVLLTSLLG